MFCVIYISFYFFFLFFFLFYWGMQKLKSMSLVLNGWQLAKMKKSIPDMSLPWNL